MFPGPIEPAGEPLMGSGAILRWLNQDGDGGDFSDEEAGLGQNQNVIITQAGDPIITQDVRFIVTQG